MHDELPTGAGSRTETLTPYSFCAFSFSLRHMSTRPPRPSSATRAASKASSVSMRIWRTEASRPPFRSSLTVSTNFLSRLRVKDGPGLSVRMRISITALYW
jgi:hypothetical protein